MSEVEAAVRKVTPGIIQNSHSDDGSIFHNVMKGAHDYFNGLFYWKIWSYMAYASIRKRYARTVIGPFWTTLSVAIFIGIMGVLFSFLWHRNVKDFMPFFSAGYVSWMFMSTSITESCSTFTVAAGSIKQMPMPYSVYAYATFLRGLIVFLHHSVVFIAMALIFHVHVTLNTLLIFPALVALCFTVSWVSILFGVFAARFRDIQQVVTSLLAVSMFVTPIFWKPSQLGASFKAKLIMGVNPLAHYVAIMRAPLLGQSPGLFNWEFVIVFSILGWMFSMYILGRYYKHIAFWL